MSGNGVGVSEVLAGVGELRRMTRGRNGIASWSGVGGMFLKRAMNLPWYGICRRLGNIRRFL